MSNDPNEGHPSEECPGAYNRVMAVQSVYTSTLRALTASLIENRVLLTKHDIECVMEALGEALSEEVHSEVKELQDHFWSISAYPDFAQKMIDGAHDEIVKSFMPKPLDPVAVMEEILRPWNREAARALGIV